MLQFKASLYRVLISARVVPTPLELNLLLKQQRQIKNMNAQLMKVSVYHYRQKELNWGKPLVNKCQLEGLARWNTYWSAAFFKVWLGLGTSICSVNVGDVSTMYYYILELVQTLQLDLALFERKQDSIDSKRRYLNGTYFVNRTWLKIMNITVIHQINSIWFGERRHWDPARIQTWVLWIPVRCSYQLAALFVDNNSNMYLLWISLIYICLDVGASHLLIPASSSHLCHIILP